MRPERSPAQGGAPAPSDATARLGRKVGYLSLFASVGTLVCCALPSLFVLIGFGAAVAAVLSTAPWLVTLSRHKDWVFAVAAVGLLANAYVTWRVLPRWAEACPADAREACERARRWGRGTLIVSLVIYLIGFFVAYLLGPLLEAT